VAWVDMTRQPGRTSGASKRPLVVTKMGIKGKTFTLSKIKGAEKKEKAKHGGDEVFKRARWHQYSI